MKINNGENGSENEQISKRLTEHIREESNKQEEMAVLQNKYVMNSAVMKIFIFRK